MFTQADIDLSRRFFEEKLKLTLGPVEMKEMMDDPQQRDRFLLLDVRNREAYAKEHVPGALNIPMDDIEHHLDEIPQDKEIIVYCWTLVCHLAARAGLKLAQHGYFVRELEGGIQQWKEYDMPLEHGAMVGVK